MFSKGRETNFKCDSRTTTILFDFAYGLVSVMKYTTFRRIVWSICHLSKTHCHKSSHLSFTYMHDVLEVLKMV